MRKNKNNKFTYAFGAAAAAVVYMVAPLPEAGAAIFKGSTTIKWNENETLKLDVELEADQIPTESLTTYNSTDLSKFTSIKATLNHWALEDGVARRREQHRFLYITQSIRLSSDCRGRQCDWICVVRREHFR